MMPQTTSQDAGTAFSDQLGEARGDMASTERPATKNGVDETMPHHALGTPQQLPSPFPTPSPTDSFPKLELPTAHDDHDGDDCNEEHINEIGKRTRDGESSPDMSSSSGGDDSSASAIEEISESQQEKPDGAAVDAPRSRTESASKRDSQGVGVRKLSASQMSALASSPESLPVAVMPPHITTNGHRKANGEDYPLSASLAESVARASMAEQLQAEAPNGLKVHSAVPTPTNRHLGDSLLSHLTPDAASTGTYRLSRDLRRPPASSRTLSTPPIDRRPSPNTSTSEVMSSRRYSANPLARPAPLNLGANSIIRPASQAAPPSSHRGDEADCFDYEEVSPLPAVHASIPLPPMSLHTHLQLELAGARPSPLYIHRLHTADTPYESSAVKFERLLNALLLPAYLESALTFGALACLDAFLYTFTLLPLRFGIAIGVLSKWWAYVFWKEVTWVVGYVWQGSWRLWQRGRRGRTMSRTSQTQEDVSQTPTEERSHSRLGEYRSASDSAASTPVIDSGKFVGNGGLHSAKHAMPRSSHGSFMRHRRTKSMPSNLTSYHKADLLQGAVIICSSLALMHIDASRMYHFIRAQSAMKLYVIYNLLEVGDRLLGAIGQDILECLFSSETLSRNSSGRSKLLLPFGMFILSAIYNVVHAVCLFYQVITLNVAVNSYSNALMTLILSNQFVEIKGSVFKKIEKENLFQLTASDVVERFQLWVILVIIGMRNIVEVGGLSVPGAGSEADGAPPPGARHNSSILPDSFTLLPSWFLSGEVLSPFLVVIGSEMLVDWIKHAYINKFNNVKPVIYQRMLDIFCKDYYTSAFGTPALTRRIGLPVLPLSCLFIRASVQIYHMFLATHLPPPIPTSTTETSLEESTPTSPAVTAALDRLDSLIRNALGRAVYGPPLSADSDPADRSFWQWTGDDVIALLTMVIFFFLAWVVLLVFKLLLGMALLKYSRERYVASKLGSEPSPTKPTTQKHEKPDAKQQQNESYYQPGKRVGGWGHIELGDERRRMLYSDDPDGLKRMRDRERKGEEAARKMQPAEDGLERVNRYEMIAKRIW